MLDELGYVGCLLSGFLLGFANGLLLALGCVWLAGSILKEWLLNMHGGAPGKGK